MIMKNVKLLLWSVINQTIFKYTPRWSYKFRRMILVAFGASLAKDARFKRTCTIHAPWNLVVGSNTYFGDNVQIYNLGIMTFGSNIIVSQRSFFCDGSHNYRKRSFDLIVRPITVADNVWIASEVFIGPGVEIGENAVIAARATVVSNIYSNSVSVGSRSKIIKHEGRVV